MPSRTHRHVALIVTLLAIALALSLLAAFNQVKAMGLSWQETNYLPILRAAAFQFGYASNSIGPLIPSLLAVLTSAAENLGVPRASGSVLVLLRIAVNVGLMLASFVYYRRLGIDWYAVVLGWAALAWSLTHTTHQSTLALESSLEGILCMTLAWACLEARRPAAMAAAVALMLNGNALLPLGIIVLTLYAPSGRLIQERLDRQTVSRMVIIAGIAAMILFGGGIRPEIAEQFQENLLSKETWLHLGLTFGVLPFLAALGWRKASLPLRYATVLMLPLTLLYRFALYDASATHGLITPLVVCVLPMALMALETPHPPPREARGTPLEGGHEAQPAPSCSVESSG